MICDRMELVGRDDIYRGTAQIRGNWLRWMKCKVFGYSLDFGFLFYSWQYLQKGRKTSRSRDEIVEDVRDIYIIDLNESHLRISNPLIKYGSKIIL